MTAIPNAEMTARLGVLRILREMIGLAAPLSVGVLAASGLQFGKIWIASHHPDPEVLTTLSLLQPYYLILLAFLETLAITNQVFSARSKKGWPKPDVRRASLCFLAVGAVVIAALVGGSIFLEALFAAPADVLPSANGRVGIFSPSVLAVLPLFVASVVPFFVFEVYNAALRGQGRVQLGLLALGILVAVDLGVTAYAMFSLRWGFGAVLLGNLVGPLVALPITVIGAYCVTRGPDAFVRNEFRKRILRLLGAVGAPIFLSMVAGVASAAVIFPAMAGFGAESAAAFLFIIRFRIIFIVPAIASGSAIAILANQNEGTPAKTQHLLVGSVALLIFYAAATAALLCIAPALLDLILPAEAPELRASVTLLLYLLAPTFFTTAIATLLQIILEQLERGIFVLAVTVIVEGLTCAAMVYALRTGSDLIQICQLMVAFSALSLVLLGGQFMLLLRAGPLATEEQHAV